MSNVHVVTVVAICNGKETYRNTVKGRIHKNAEIRKAMATIADAGEIWTTEENARAWAVWSYKAGDRCATRARSEPKMRMESK